MRKYAILFLLLNSILSYGQDQIFSKGGQSLSCYITRISPDSVHFVRGGFKYRIYKDDIKTARSSDKFKSFLLKNPNFYDSENLNLEYTNFCLNKFRQQREIGYSMQFSGAVIAVASVYLMEDSNSKLIGASVGSLISLVGFFVNWGASSHLQNLSISPDYQVGLGYYFTF